MLAHPLARQQNNSCHTHSHKQAERVRERGLKTVKESREERGESGKEKGREWETGRVCRCAFVCESLEAFGDGSWEVVVAFVYGTQPRDDSNGRIIRSTRAYNRGIPITRGVRGAAHTLTHTSWGSDIIINCI